MPTSQMFNTVAWFSRLTAGRRGLASTEQGCDSVFASSPDAAALRWSTDQRAAVDRIIVWPPKPHRIYAVYQGPAIVYRREDGKLVEIERRAL